MQVPSWPLRRWVAAVGVVVLVAGVAAALVANGDDGAVDAGSSTSTSASTSTSQTTTTKATTTSAPTTTIARPSGCPAIPARHGLDPNRPRYTVRVDADPSTGKVSGDLTVRFTPDLEVDRLVFRLWPNQPRLARAGVKLTTGTPVSEGASLDVARPDPTTLEVLLPSVAAPGRVIEVSMPFSLDVPGPSDERVSRDSGALRLGTFLPLLAWEPGVGWSRQPPTSALAEAVSSPAADWSVTIAVPKGNKVLTSGRISGANRWTGQGLRDFAVTIGPLDVATAIAHAPGEVVVTVGVQRGTGASAAAFLAQTISSLEGHARRFGAYPWPSLTMGITAGFDFGIEFPGHIMQGPATLGRTVSHEVGHMWFYGLVGNDQGRDPWLDEGLTSYAEARHDGTSASFVGREIPSDGRGHAGESMSFWNGHTSSYYRSVYVQTAAALLSLGDPALVDCALALHVARSAFSIATEEDLLTALEAVFPDARARLAPYGLP